MRNHTNNRRGPDNFVDVLSQAARKPRMSLWEAWGGRAIRLTDGGFWASLFGVDSASGKTVTVDNSLQLAAVWACVRLISQTISTLPLGLYERQGDGGRKLMGEHPLYRVIHDQPNADMTAVTFWEAVVSSMLLWGNAYIEIHRSGGQVIGLSFLLPSRMQVTQNKNTLQYVYNTESGQREIPRSRMMHIPAFTLDGIMGLSPITYACNVFGSAMSAEEAAARTFKNGMMPTVYFKVDSILKPSQREEFREYAKSVSGAINAGRSPVLEQGMTADTIGINPTDAQLLESRLHMGEEICRFFLVDPSMVGYGHKDSNWGTGLEQKKLGFLTFALAPWLRRIEQAIKRSLIAPDDQDRLYAEYAIEGLLRADSTARASFYSQMVQNGIFTRDDCRVLENLPRRGGNADVLTVQTNLSPIDLLGQHKDEEHLHNALSQWLSIDGRKSPGA
ncbi:phage portal protein [Orrella sp. 11846]|uniref:phage portal protein n=1 Tax=Orrella sp. 11846 TaxID=3409913 RepID=UPI003B5BE86B